MKKIKIMVLAGLTVLLVSGHLRAQADGEGPGELAKIEATWREYLSSSLEGRDLEERVKDEISIQKKLLALDEAKREKESEKLHRREADGVIKALNILKDYPEDYAESLGQRWRDWFWKSDLGRTNWLTDERDALEKKEIVQRKRRATKARKEVYKDLRAHWAQLGLRQGHRAALHFGSAWDSLIDFPRRHYKKERAEALLSLKRNGFDPKALDLFFSGIDPLFEGTR